MNNMPFEKKYSILFVLNEASPALQATLPDICNGLIKMGHEVHVIYSPQNFSEDFEVELRKVPWIHAKKIFISNKFNISWADVPFTIRRYIKNHDGIDLIHSFGLCCGVLSYPAGFGFKAATINTPDKIVDIIEQNTFAIWLKFIIDNIRYVFNRLWDRILFASEVDKNNSSQYISYRNVDYDILNFVESGSEISEKLLQIYAKTISAKKK